MHSTMGVRSLAQLHTKCLSEQIPHSVHLNRSRQLIYPTTRSLSTSPCLLGRRQKKARPQYRDPYTIKQEEARKAANIARSQETKARRAANVGDPIRGISEPTPFVQSLDSARDSIESGNDVLPPAARAHEQKDAETKVTAQAAITSNSATSGLSSSPAEARQKTDLLNHFFTTEDLKSSLDQSLDLSAPYISPERHAVDVANEESRIKEHEEKHERRQEAITRILAPENASSSQRSRINVQRCIGEFGRHRTDVEFKQQQAPGSELHPNLVEVKQRAGPDTGSSEVQIAILTAKIRVMMTEFEGRGKLDKVNKRNLRLLLHRRQKLLKYFERQDRGGPRWRHLLETLGLTPATWKGEINLK